MGRDWRGGPEAETPRCRPFGDPAQARVFVIGHDPRLRRSHTRAEAVFFLDYLARDRPAQKSEAAKYDLASAAVKYIEHLTGGMVPLTEMYFTNLCNEFLPHAPRNHTVLIPDDVADRGVAAIEQALGEGKPKVIVPMSAQVFYHLVRSGFVAGANERRDRFLREAAPRPTDEERGAYVGATSGAFLEVCGKRFLHGSTAVVPVVHVKSWPLGANLRKYESPMRNAGRRIQQALSR